MIISRTPYRISFFGGGTDYPKWYRENGGAVVTTTVDKYCYINCRYLPPFFAHKHRIIYTRIENVNNISEIQHPAVRAVLSYLDIKDGLEIHHDGDLPARSGMGSSSSFTVGLIHAMKALKNEFISKQDLGELAIHIEQNVIKETVGSQDQIAVTHGGLNRIDFKPDGTIDVTPLLVTSQLRANLQNSMMLFFTGISRTASDIAKQKIENFDQKKNELLTMKHMADEATKLFQSNSSTIGEIGKLMHESWKLKKSLSSAVSNNLIDECYAAALSAGALGGKILGAGGGGFLFILAKPENHDRIREKLSKLLYVNIRLENTGSKIVLYDPQI